MRRAALVALVALAGCGPAVGYVETGTPGPRALPAVAPGRVRLLYAGGPLPPFHELGYLEATQTASAHAADGSGFLDVLVAEAAAHGCNAIVLHDGCIRSSWSQRHGRYDFARLTATCVRIDDPLTEPTAPGVVR